MISAEQQKQALGCDDDSCLAQLGGALGVPYLLTGSLGMLGGRFMLNVKLLAVDEAKVAGRITKMFDGSAPLATTSPQRYRRLWTTPLALRLNKLRKRQRLRLRPFRRPQIGIRLAD